LWRHTFTIPKTISTLKIRKDHIREGLYGSVIALLFLSLPLILSCEGPAASVKNENLLSDSLATIPAIELYRQMEQISASYIMVGHQDALAYGMGWRGAEFKSDIHDVCGDFPTVYGWDLGHIDDLYNIDSVPFADMIRWAKEVHKRGGINTYSWHILNLVTGGSSWDSSECVSSILPGGKYHEDFMKKLDRAAAFFNRLRDQDSLLIPVLFRPWHEMNGGWFWWGSESCTPEEYKQLWRFTTDYLRNEHKLNNLIYIYSTDVFENSEEYLTYYPGDAYVDILGYDDYKGLYDRSTTYRTIEMLEILSDIAREKTKLYTISEGGVETIPDSTWFSQVVLPALTSNGKTRGISYILFWRNGRPDHFYAPYPGHASAEDFIEFMKDSSIVLLEELQQILNKK